MYDAVGLDISAYYPADTMVSTVSLMKDFATQDNSTLVMTIAENADAAAEKTVYEMLEKDLTHGPKFADYENSTIALSSLEAGDVLYLVERTSKVYWMCIYQGEGKFLVNYNDWTAGIKGYMTIDVSEEGKWEELLTSGTIEGITSTWQYCFVLRPANLLKGA